MSEEVKEAVEAEAGPGGLKVKARGTDIIAVVMLVTGTIGVVLLWMHMQQAQADISAIANSQKEANTNMVSALKEVAATNRELVTSTKVTNCLIARDESGARFTLQQCERITR